ncbi:MAG: gamma carbonic anhydrase family protein [Candidatus Sumerlaeia bacterium]|nr:gamma carbonic anhydrase family protein [Candidatus Sumerlaeia bacterium]
MPIIPFEGRIPKIHPTAFIAPTAIIIGDVTVEEGASIWYGAVLRGDLDPIVVGKNSNVQDNSVLHTATGSPCIVEENVTVGHMACLHGCLIQSGSLIGMMATVLNDAVIGRDSIVGAGAVVAERKTFEPRQLIIGVPAKAVRELTDADVKNSYENTARYVKNGPRHRAMLLEWMEQSGWKL